MLVDGKQIAVAILRVRSEADKKSLSHIFVNLPYDSSQQVDSLLHPIRQDHLPPSNDPFLSCSVSFSFHKFHKAARPPKAEKVLTDLQNAPYIFDNPRIISPVSPSESLATFSKSVSQDEPNYYELIVVEYVRVSVEEEDETEESYSLLQIEELDKIHAAYWNKELKEKTEDLPKEDPKDEGRTVTFLTLPDHAYDEFKYIMVREDYKKCYTYMGEQQAKGVSKGMVVTGQPGIGKTFFLFYCLLRRLSDALPTMFSVANGPFFYLGHLGVSSNESWSKEFPRSVRDGSWILFDVGSAPSTPEIITSLTSTPNLFVIQTTSPNENRYKAWLKERFGTIFLMEPWTWDEILAGAILQRPQGFTKESLRKSFDMFGPSARVVYKAATSNDYFRHHQQLIESGETAKPLPSHNLIVPRRVEGHPVILGRSEIAYKCIFKLFVDRFSNTLNAFASGLSTALKGVPFAASTRGYLHEAAVHRFFTNLKLSLDEEVDATLSLSLTVSLRSMQGPKHRKKSKSSSYRVTDDSKAVELIVQPRKGHSFDRNFFNSNKLSDDGYYVPMASNNAAYDALFVLDDTLYILQVASGEDHGVSTRGMRTLQKMMTEVKREIKKPWGFVCVVPLSGRVVLSVPHAIARKCEYYTLELDTGVDVVLSGGPKNVQVIGNAGGAGTDENMDADWGDDEDMDGYEDNDEESMGEDSGD